MDFIIIKIAKTVMAQVTAHQTLDAQETVVVAVVQILEVHADQVAVLDAGEIRK